MSTTKKYLSVFLTLILVLSLCGCGKNDEKAYQSYVKSLIAINYLGASDDFIKNSGANKKDATALYNANIDNLAESILKYYGITLSEDSDLMEEYRRLSEKIYEKVNYKVSETYKADDEYKVDVEVSPIDIFNQTNDDILKHIDTFNKKIADGEFNNYTVDQYNDAFSAGILDILNTACDNIQYAEPKTVTVTIITNDKTYYISDEDFLAIDALILNVPGR